MSRHAVEQRHLEATRYALLRRLTLAMRHQLVVHLQPMSLITELMERRLQQPEPPLAQVRDGMDKVHTLSRAAVQACLDVVSWLAPDPAERVAAQDGVRECVDLLRSSFSFRGFALAERIDAAPQQVSRGAVRQVLPAALLALTDWSTSPADLAVAAEPRGDDAVALVLELRQSAGEPGFAGNQPYRLIGWDDVELLAAAEGVRVQRADGVAQLVFVTG
ncbi:MAG: hypothetical protein V4864_06340 [Pseudomonadota bacterium]